MSQFVKLLDPHCSEDSVNVKFKMSITSSTTSSGRDHDVPSTKVIFRDKLCLVSITRRDDTLMDASSISEEDIIEICITKGHTHPLGVLHYSAMESVVLFHSTDELQCTTRRMVKTTELQGEAITVRAMAPSEAHVAVYLVMSCSNPSNGEREPHTSPQQTPPSRGTLHHLQAELGNLANLTQEIVQCGINVPPSFPLQMNGYAHWAVGSLRRMTGRLPFQEGKVGSIEATHFIFRARVISWRKGSLWTTPARTMPCSICVRYGATDYHPDIGSALGHPKNQYF